MFGPGGLIKPESVRLDLYEMITDREYGVEIHPAMEMCIMPAGKCFWEHSGALYCCERSNGRSHDYSPLPHTTIIEDQAFMSVYAWIGYLSEDACKISWLPQR